MRSLDSSPVRLERATFTRLALLLRHVDAVHRTAGDAENVFGRDPGQHGGQNMRHATKAISAIVRSAGVLCAAICLACGDSESPAQAKPATFMDRCESDAGICQSPFMCLEIKPESERSDGGSICTQPCESTADCPRWLNESGHCRGEFQSLCIEGVCQGWCA
jgi:hypothetical protein